MVTEDLNKLGLGRLVEDRLRPETSALGVAENIFYQTGARGALLIGWEVLFTNWMGGFLHLLGAGGSLQLT